LSYRSGVTANLAVDTTIELIEDGLYRAELSPDWSVWGPNGGYLAALALRAAGAHRPGSLPAAISCHFVGVAEFRTVDLRVTTVRGSRRATSVQVQMLQDGAPVLSANVWTVAPKLRGPHRAWHPAPDVPGPEEMRPIEELMARDDGIVLPIWLKCYEVRLKAWQPGAWTPQQGVPRVHGWLRMREPIDTGDPWLDACRAVFGVDVAQFPAIAQSFSAEELTFVAPSMDLHVAFHGRANGEEWMLIEAEGLAAGDGRFGASAKLWSASGELLASGAQQMLYWPFRR
jgi:acyl-CoA thioesterase II